MQPITPVDRKSAILARPATTRTRGTHVPIATGGEWPAHWPELLLAIAVLVNLAVALTAKHFPYLDAPNHLARFVLMDRYWFGERPTFIVVHLLPTPYILGDLLGVALVHTLGPAGGMRAFVALILIVLPLGMYRLIRVTAPERRGWALMGAFLGFSAFLMQGTLNYELALGFSFLWLAYWWPRRVRASWRARAVMVASAVLLFFLHMAGAVIILGVIGLEYLTAVARARRIARDGARRTLTGGRLVTVGIVIVAVGAAWGWGELLQHGLASPGGTLVFRPPLRKLLMASYPLYWTSYRQLAAMLALFSICVITFVLANRGRLRVNVFAVAALAFAALYFAFPKQIPSAGTGLDVRWLPIAYLLPFCVQSVGRRREARAVLLVPFAACLLAAALAWRTTRTVDHYLAPFDRIIDQVPPNTALLPLISTRHPLGPIAPDWHFASWHVIRNHGRVPRLFGAIYPRDDSPLQFNLLHFAEPHHLYVPADDWGSTPTLQPLDWARVDHDYDYIMEAGHDGPVRAYLAARAHEIARAGGVTLYQVNRVPSTARVPVPPSQTTHAAQ